MSKFPDNANKFLLICVISIYFGVDFQFLTHIVGHCDCWFLFI